MTTIGRNPHARAFWVTNRVCGIGPSTEHHIGKWAARPIAAYGSIGETLVHLAATEQRYIHRLGGEPPGAPIREEEPPGFAALKQATQRSGELLAAMARTASPDWQVSGVTDGRVFESEAVVFLVQALGHSAGHRTQVISMCSALGVGPADLDERLDGWAWGEASGALRTKPADA